MSSLIDQMQKDYPQAPNKTVFIESCQSQLETMQKDPILNCIHQEIERLQKMWHSTGAAKADGIIEAMQSVPLSDRNHQIFDNHSGVQDALAVKRDLFSGQLKEAKKDTGGSTPSIIESSAASAYKTVKAKYIVFIAAREAAKKDEEKYNTDNLQL